MFWAKMIHFRDTLFTSGFKLHIKVSRTFFHFTLYDTDKVSNSCIVHEHYEIGLGSKLASPDSRTGEHWFSMLPLSVWLQGSLQWCSWLTETWLKVMLLVNWVRFVRWGQSCTILWTHQNKKTNKVIKFPNSMDNQGLTHFLIYLIITSV